jgi:hypothetical protein
MIFLYLGRPLLLQRCFPPAPESGAVPEDDDLSEDAQDNVEVVKDSDASEEK